MTSRILLFATIVFIQQVAQGQDLDFDIFEYRYLGPTRGGRVTTVTGVAAATNTFYMGATGGGVWKTEDYGLNWKNVSDGFFASPSIGAIRVADNDKNIVYVGTGSDGLRSNVIAGKGVYKSIDGGGTWTNIGLKNSGHIGALEIHPGDNNTVFVAAIGQAFGPNAERGIFRTRNGGKTWEKVLYLSDTTGFSDLELMPSNPNIVYATAWRAERKPWTIISGGAENGIYKSLDGGDTWERTGRGLPELMGKIDLAVCPADSRLLYALVEANEKERGLYISQDQGANFELVSNHSGLTDRPFYYCNVDVDPQNPDVIYVNSTRFHQSVDRGKTWTRVSTPHGDNHDMWIHPSDSKLIVQGNDGGANVSYNGMKSWTSQMNQPTAELYTIEVDNQYPYWVYGGQQDNYSTVSVPSLPPYRHQAGSNGYIMNTGGCETGPAVPHPDNHNIVYSNCKGRFGVYNKTTGQEMHYDVGAANMYGHNPEELKFRFQRVSPIHISPHDSRIIYHTSQFVHKTMDEGKTWEIISPDLTACTPETQVRSGWPLTNDITGEEFYSTIYAIRESPVTAGVIWVGANDGPIHVTTDSGANWSNVTPVGLPPGGRVDCVEPSPHNADKAYAAILRYQLADWKPYIYRTNDNGASWKLLTSGDNGIPDDHPVRVIREDPDREGLLYAGTDFGVFISFDDGGSWQSFQQNLPVTPITDLKVHRGDLVISTMGRGFYVLDGLHPLHQDFENADQDLVRLYKPRNEIRSRQFGTAGRGIYPTYPSAGIDLDYYLPGKAEGIVLNVLDSEGNVIRSLTSGEISEDSSVTRDMATNTFTQSINQNLKLTAGLHRFRWDFRRTGAWSSNKSRRYSGGPLVTPGEYTFQLVVDGESFEQKATIKQDPRTAAAGVTADDLAEQEALCRQIIDLMSNARHLEADLKKQLKKAEDNQKAVIQDQLDLLVQSTDGRYTKPKLLAQIRYLYGIVSRSDQAPGNDAKERLTELREQFEQMDNSDMGSK